MTEGKLKITCTRCGNSYGVRLFVRRDDDRSKRRTWCRNCRRLYVNQWEKNNPDKVSAKNRRAYLKRKAKLIDRMRWGGESQP